MQLRIGEFARIGQVPVKTLRYYDEIGLLKPADTDRFTGYRLYSLAQLPDLNRILALKDLGLSLEQIAALMAHDTADSEVRGMLRLRQIQLNVEIENLERQQARVVARLAQIEREGTMSNYAVLLKTVEPMLVASQRVTIPEDAPPVIEGAFAEVFGFIKRSKAKVSGPSLSVWHTEAYTETDQVAEAAAPLASAVPGDGQINVQTLPEVEVASVVHNGGWDDLGQAYQAVLKWIELNGYRVSGPFREIYHEYHADDEQESTTEIQFPVTAA